MRLPSFTAEAALFKSSGTYRTTFAPIGTGSGVSPQQLIGGLRWYLCWRCLICFPLGGCAWQLCCRPLPASGLVAGPGPVGPGDPIEGGLLAGELMQ